MKLRLTVLTGLVALSLAGCGSSTPATHSPAAVGPTGTTSATAPPTATKAAPPAGVNPCQLVTLAEAATATGLTGLVQASADPNLCSYEASAGYVDVNVAPARYDPAAVATEKQQVGPSATDVPGLGDAAFVANVEGNGVGEAWVHGLDISIRLMTTATSAVTAASALLHTAVGHLPRS